MTLTCSLLTQTDTAALALACFRPALNTPLFAIHVCEEMKLVACLKTTALPLPLPLYVANISRHLANFHPR